MKLNKATIYFYGYNGIDAVAELEHNVFNSELKLEVFDLKEVEIGEWYDDIDLNYVDCKQETFEQYFNLDHDLINKMVIDFMNLWKTREYTELGYDEIKDKVLGNYRELNHIELKHFEGQIR